MARTKGSIGSQTAERILDESQKLFARFGYAAVSMRQIAQAVGVEAPSIYNYFPTKQQILFTIMRDHMHDLLAAWEGQDLSNLDAAGKLDAFARFHIAFNTRRPDAVFISYMELRALDDANHKKIEGLRQEYEYALRDIIEEGMAQGQFAPDDPHITAMSILASLTGVNTWFREQGRLSKSKVEEFYARLTLRTAGCREVTAHV